MKVEGTYTFAAQRDMIWETILDPEVLAKVLPGVQELEKSGESSYKARMKLRIGPVQGVFNGTVDLSELNQPESFHLVVDGRGASGFVKGEGDLKLAAEGENTVMTYAGEAQVGGRLASVGQRLMDSSTQAIIDQSLESLNAQVTARVQGVEDLEAVAGPKAPSELEFAAGVTRRMLADLVPADQRQDLVKTALIALGLLFVFRIINDWWTNRLANKVADVLEQRQRKDRS